MALLLAPVVDAVARRHVTAGSVLLLAMPWLCGSVGLLLVLLASARRRRAHPPPDRFLRRRESHLELHQGPVPEATMQLQEDGHCVVKRVLSPDDVAALKAEVLGVFEKTPSDGRPYGDLEEDGSMYRYEMFNRGALCHRVMEHEQILRIVEPLLGDDCHVIANTAWRNPPGRRGIRVGTDWHIDAGPHVPRSRLVPWPEQMPYPIFVISVHVYLEGCRLEDGPTGVIPGSHKSGQVPPPGDRWNDALSWDGRHAVRHVVDAGDVGMFVSDVWHRRTPPTETGKGRLFLQICYGRRDIAQRLRLSSEANQASEDARRRAVGARQRQLMGIHPAHFYDG